MAMRSRSLSRRAIFAAIVVAACAALWAQEPAPPVIEAAKFVLPVRVEVGEKLTMAGAFRVIEELPGERAVRLELSKEGLVVAAAEAPFDKPVADWAPGEIHESQLELIVPPWLRAGTYRLELRAEGARVVDRAEQALIRSVEVHSPAPSPTTASVAEVYGVPTMLVNGEPIGGVGYATDKPQASAIRPIAASGVRLVSFPLTADYHLYGLAEQVWSGPDSYDYGSVDERVTSVLEAAPDAYLLPRVFLCSPPWWDGEHGGEMALFGHGRHRLDLAAPGKKSRYPSFGSTRWREAAAENLRRLLQHLESAPYGDRIIGYQLEAGVAGNWQQWGVFKSAFADYAPACQREFRRWLRTRYGDLPGLRAAWGGLKLDWGAPRIPDEKLPPVPFDAGVTWGDIGLPPQNLREKGTKFSLHDPAGSQAIVDCQRFLSEVVADALLELATAAKEATQRRKLVGAAYGHVLEQAWHPWGVQHGGHLALAKVLGSRDVDFLAGPAAKTDLTLGTGYNCFPAPVRSVRLHGKVWLDVCDIPTHLSPGPAGKHAKPADAAGTRALLRREAAQALSQGAALVWTDRTGGAYREDGVEKLLGELAALADAQVNARRDSAAQIAAVVDLESAAYFGPGNGLSQPLLAAQCVELGHIGAPVDLVTLGDLLAGRCRPYRLYVFFNAFRSNPALRAAIRGQVARDRQTAIWIYAPGALDPAGVSARASRELTGISVTLREKMMPLRVAVSAGHPYTDDMPGRFEYGTTKPVGPIFQVIDPETEGIGKIKELGAVGLCVRESRNWTSIFSAAPNLPATMLRNIAREAGVHLYLETGDVVYANQGFVAVHAAEAGKKRIKLPRPAVVRDLDEGRLVAENVSSFEAELGAGETGMWGLEPVATFE